MYKILYGTEEKKIDVTPIVFQTCLSTTSDVSIRYGNALRKVCHNGIDTADGIVFQFHPFLEIRVGDEGKVEMA